MNSKRSLVVVGVLIAAASCLRVSSEPPTAVVPPEIHCKHFLHGCSLGTPPSNDLVIRDCHALSSNDATKFPDWVCFRLTSHEVDGDLDLERQWRNAPWPDASVTPEGRPTGQDDYRGASAAHGYDRGHMAPLASLKGS